jgi:hypothetical protein
MSAFLDSYFVGVAIFAFGMLKLFYTDTQYHYTKLLAKPPIGLNSNILFVRLVSVECVSSELNLKKSLLVALCNDVRHLYKKV